MKGIMKTWGDLLCQRYHTFIRIPNRDAVQDQFKQAGIPTAVHYLIPLNKQPVVADAMAQLPVGDAVAQRVLSLPMHAYLDQGAQAAVVAALAVR